MSFQMIEIVILKDLAIKTGLVIVAVVVVWLLVEGAIELLEMNGFGKEDKKKERKP